MSRSKIPVLSQNSGVFTRSDIAKLKRTALQSPKGRSRYLLHSGPKDIVQEMIIAATRETYIPPLRQLGQTKSFLILEGCIEILFFNSRQKCDRRIVLSTYESGKPFIFRLKSGRWHMTRVVSRIAVFHETISGPYRPTQFASWAPDGMDADAVRRFLKQFTR